MFRRVTHTPVCTLLLGLLVAIGCADQKRDPFSGTLAVDDIELPHVVKETGKPMLVTCDPLVAQRAFSQELRNHLRLVFMEPRIGMEHERPVDYATITMATLVEDIERVRAHLELEKAAVLGHSICGILALAYARHFPTNVSHVILIGTPPGWNSGMSAAAEYG